MPALTRSNTNMNTNGTGYHYEKISSHITEQLLEIKRPAEIE